MVAALALALLLAGVCVFVFGFVLQEESRGLPGGMPGVDRVREWFSARRALPRAAQGWLWVQRALGEGVRGAARALSAARDRRRLAVEARQRSGQARARTARIRFDQAFEQTAPELAGPSERTVLPGAVAPKSSRIVAAVELAILIAVTGGIVAAVIFGAAHVM